MPTIIKRALPENQAARELLGGELPATLRETLGATFSDPTLRPTELAATQRQLRREDPNDNRIRSSFLGVDIAGSIADITEEPEPLVDAETLNAQYGELGLSFDQPRTKAYAEILAKQKREEAIRADVIARGPAGIGPTVARFGAALAGAALDPVNIAASFVPVVGQARYAGMVARMGKTNARITRGMVEGAIGNAAIEPIVYGLASDQQLDYTMSDALVNVALGGFLGGGLHAIGGKMADFIASKSPELREAALRTSAAQLAEGRQVDIEPVIRFDEMTFSPVERVDFGEAITSLRGELTAIAGNKLSRGEVKQLEAELKELEFQMAKVQETRAETKKAVKQQGTKGRQANREADRQNAEEVQRLDESAQIIRNRLQANESPRQAEAELSRLEQQIKAKGEPEVVLNTALERLAQNIPDFDIARFQALEPRVTQNLTVAQARKQAADLAKYAAAPERDITADFDAADEVNRLISQPIGDDLEAELEFTNTLVDELRTAGVLTGADEQAIKEADELLNHAEAYAKGAEAAARCLAR